MLDKRLLRQLRKKIYWGENSWIRRANLDGTNHELFIRPSHVGSEPSGLALDISGRKIYWTEWEEGRIECADFDGRNVKILITELSGPGSIALDVDGNKMYWTETRSKKIRCANLNGKNVKDVVTTGLSWPSGLALDVSGRKIYWTDIGTSKIQRANLDGKNVEDVALGLGSSHIALDVSGRKIYWTEGRSDKIQRANLDGNSVENLITIGLSNPTGIALDVSGRKMYWTELISRKIRKIRSANLDGKNVEDIVVAQSDFGVDGLDVIALDLSGDDLTEPELYSRLSAISKSTLAPGESFKLSVFVGNNGNRQAASTTLRYYRSDDNTITTSDTQVDTDSVSALSAGSGRNESTTLNAPTIPGTYYYGACVDSIVGESDPNNNCSSAIKITVSAPTQRPDLIVESPRVNDSTLSPGQSFTLSATVRNRGAGQSPSTTLTYYRSSNSDVSTSDTRVGTDSVSSLNANGTSSESITLTAPNTPGTYYYGACVGSVSDESDTDNNCSAGVRVTVQSAPAQRPDLVIDLSYSEKTLASGEMFWLSAAVRNRGTGQSNSTTLRFYRSSNDTISTGDTEIGTINVSALSANRSTGYKSIYYGAPITPGTYYYGACVDTVANESDPNNNCSNAIRITVEIPTANSDLLPVPIYWTDSSTGKIQRGNMDGTGNIEDLFTRQDGLQYPSAIALDVSDGKMYWTDWSSLVTQTTYNIQRANMDGTGEVENLVVYRNRNTRLRGLALDISNGKMYWTKSDIDTDKIQRGNMDGTGTVEDLFTQQNGLDGPASLALDVSNGKIYWTDFGTDKIQRGNMDGTGTVEDLFTQQNGLDGPASLALDVSNGKIYWTDFGTDKIQRGNMDGTGTVEDLFTRADGLRYPRGIALDVSNGKIYWTDFDTDKIQRGNMDGTGTVEDVVTGLAVPPGLALAIPPDTTPISKPDLVIESVQAEPSTVAPGAEFKLYATLKNRGTAKSAATTVRYYRSNDNTISTSDTQLGTGKRDPLSPNGTIRRYLTVTAPTTPGTYYYGVCVDTVANESDTDNNCSTAISVTVQAPAGKPDIVVETPIVSDSTLTPGQSFTLYATVKNSGEGQSTSTTLRYYRSSNDTISTSDTAIGTDSLNVIAADGESDQSVTLTAPSTPGTYYYGGLCG